MVGCALGKDAPPQLELIDGGAPGRDRLQLRADAQLPAAPDAAPAAPGKTCKEVDRCMMGCNDEACEEACRQQGSAEAQAQLDALESCATSAASGSCSATLSKLAWLGCVGAACPTQFSACFDAPAGGSGQATCLQIYACSDGCDKSDSLCLAQCVWRGTAAAQSAFYAWSKCSLAAQAKECQTACATSAKSCSECKGYYCPSTAAACKAN
jgi:hypothetical protein